MGIESDVKMVSMVSEIIKQLEEISEKAKKD